VVPCSLVRSWALGRTVMALGAAFALAACAPVDSPRRGADTPTVRCVNEPGRGQSLDATRPLFFLFCAQAP
jgi:hypothetical protein